MAIVQKYVGLMEKAAKLEEKARRIRNLVGLQYSWKDVSDDQRRLFLNNEEPGSKTSEHNHTFKLKEFERGINVPSGLFASQKMEVLEQFSRRGDLLCRKVLEYLTEAIGGKPVSVHYYALEPILEKTTIPEKILARKMTEEEYFGYLNGILPIAITNELTGRKEQYLPKDKKEIT